MNPLMETLTTFGRIVGAAAGLYVVFKIGKWKHERDFKQAVEQEILQRNKEHADGSR